MLARLLADVRRATDLAPLFRMLGYLPAREPLPDGTELVARWKGFRVVATDAADACAAARALARRLGAAGHGALAAAVGDGCLALAAPRVGQPGSTRALVVPLTDPPPLVLQQLEDLRPRSRHTALEHALAVAERLSSEAAGARFFTVFRATLDRMAGSLDRRHTPADRRLAALLALSRVLFLYFVQAKGWLDGRTDYLRVLLDAALAARRPFHRTALDPLCFGTLNRPPGRRSRRLRLGAVPYLNGGLFEPHPLERRIGPVHFANHLWRDAFDGLFERFRFCMRETEQVDAIAPDMLGRVFERLMEPDERLATGSFYTPEDVVRGLVAATIETALSGAGGLPANVARRLMARDPLAASDAARARDALRRLRLLDPAAGSGAFLLGALDCLTELRLSLERQAEPAPRWAVRRAILRENLFGVDLNPVAVRLAELRLWLAVVADDPTTDIAAIAPLPNLDGIMRQGDTLFDPLSATGCGGRASSEETALAAAAARDALFDGRGLSRTSALREQRRRELELARRRADHVLARTEAALAELRGLSSNRDLFGRRVRPSPVQRARLRALTNQRAALLRARRALQDGALPFFAFEVHAPDVMAAGGFAAVVGNPPWVRAERLPAAQRDALAERFTWWRTVRRRGFAHRPDLAVAFLERALELAAPGGAIGFLVPSKLASADYGETARHRLVRETTIAYLHRVADRDASRFGATTYPLAVVIRNAPPPPDHRIRLTFDGEAELAQAALNRPGPWILLAGRERDALACLRESGRPLRDVMAPALGVKTGADGVLVGEVVEAGADIARVRFGNDEVRLELTALRPTLRGRDVAAYRVRPARVVLWGHGSNGEPLGGLPPRARRYVARRRTVLEGRADYRGGPLWTLFRVRAALAPNRVVWPDIARRPRAVALDESDAADAVPLNTCYVAAAPDRETALATAAVLNSTWAAVLTAWTADEARGGYRRVNARVAGQLPVPVPSPARRALAHLSDAAHRGDAIDRDDLDDAAADALDLPYRIRRVLRSLDHAHRRSAGRG